MKTFWSHTKKINGKKVPIKKLKVHTSRVTAKAVNQTTTNSVFEKVVDFVRNIGKYHDLGKYTPYFQNYLLKDEVSKFKQHSKFGAFTLFQKYESHGEKLNALFAFYIILHHHSSLTNFDEIKTMANLEGDQKFVYETQLKSLKADIKQIATELGEPSLELFLNFPEERLWQKLYRSFPPKKRGIEYYFFLNYTFSLLIEADKLDASETPVYITKTLPNNAVDEFIKNSKRKSTKDKLRNEVRVEVISQLPKIEEQRLFTLTAPTGVGKTLTSLDFALKLKKQDLTLAKGQIIYALPFINIIEQGFDEYTNVFDKYNCKILAHYQYADVFGEDREKVDFEGNENEYGQKVMALDTWQSDIVITSFVQFFHTLIGNKNKLLKKFNHFSNSIIILDEVQTLRLELLPVIGATLYYLTQLLNARVIMMTATKPEIMKLAFKKILGKRQVELKDCLGYELLQSHEKVYKKYKRTQIIPLLDISFTEEEPEKDFVKKIFSKKWDSSKSCLIVVNKVQRSIDLYNFIRDFLQENNNENPVYCLSTNIVPIDRLGRIERIKEDLKKNMCPILISTQVVEAGVDLDFDMGFRDLGPIDSIIQVAGRINRDSDPLNPDIEYKPLYVMDFGDCRKIYDATTDEQVKKSFQDKSAILENEYLDLVTTYFNSISVSPFDDSLKTFERMEKLEYGDIWEDFQIIKQMSNVVSVFVECDDRATDVKIAFQKLCLGQLKKEEFDKDFKRDFNQRIIAIPKYLCEELEELVTDKILVCPFSRYDFQTGYKRNEKIYTPTTFAL